MDIAAQSQKILPLLDQQTLITPLQEMPTAFMPPGQNAYTRADFAWLRPRNASLLCHYAYTRSDLASTRGDPAWLHSHDAYTLCDGAYTPGHFGWLLCHYAYTQGNVARLLCHYAYTPGHIAWLHCHNPYTPSDRAYTLGDYAYTPGHTAESHCQRHYPLTVIRWERGARYQRNCGSATGGEDLSAGGKLFRAFPPAWPQPCSKE
jgi:hypothetical protein